MAIKFRTHSMTITWFYTFRRIQDYTQSPILLLELEPYICGISGTQFLLLDESLLLVLYCRPESYMNLSFIIDIVLVCISFLYITSGSRCIWILLTDLVLIMVVMALLNISNLAFWYPICTTWTPTLPFSKNT